MAFGTRVVFAPIRELDGASITGSYVALGTPLADHGRIITLTNATGQQIYISFNGIDDNLRLASNSFKLLDLSTNKIREDGLFLAVGTQIFVRYVSTTSITGALWAEIMSGEGGK